MCGMGTALIDKWSRVSLVAETGIARERKFTRHVLLIHSITSNLMETKGQITLYIGETSQEFVVAGNLPTNCDIIRTGVAREIRL